MHRSPLGFMTARMLVIGLLMLAFIISAAAPPVDAAGPDAGTNRLLIADMESLKASVGKLSGALAKQDFETAGSQVSVVSSNWPAVREELARRGDSSAIGRFESALEAVQAAVESQDSDAAAASAADLSSALAGVNSALASVDVDGGRVIQALVLPLLLIAVIALVVPGVARRVGVKL